MSEPRLYLYRKAGREVWDAEMWLSDGRRRVWRTGIADRAEAEHAAQTRLKALLALAAEPNAGATAASASSPAGAHAQVTETDMDDKTQPIAAELLASIPPKAADLERRFRPVAVACSGGWSERFDRWFFDDLASLAR